MNEVSLEVPEIVQTEPEGIDIILDQTEVLMVFTQKAIDPRRRTVRHGCAQWAN